MPTIEEAVLTVSEQGGRGFLVADPTRPRLYPPLVLTAAHCLPFLPPPHPFAYTEERTYPRLLGRLGAKLTVWAECLFVDPIGDIAILGCPDNQSLSDEADAYEALVNGRPLLPIGQVEKGGGPGLVLTLDGRWHACSLRADFGVLRLGDGELPTGDSEPFVKGGMSGSPILDASHRAVGVISTRGLHPVLARHLPRWFFAGRRIGRGVVRVWRNR